MHACQYSCLQQVQLTWLGGVALGGRVVPGGITLCPTCVWVTAVQLAVKEMGAVFSSTCAAQHQTSQGEQRYPGSCHQSFHITFVQGTSGAVLVG